MSENIVLKLENVTMQFGGVVAVDSLSMNIAAASILAYTLAANVQNMEASGRVGDTVLKLNPGSAEIACKASNKYKAVVELVFSTVCAGFEILAADCPGNIRFEIHA